MIRTIALAVVIIAFLRAWCYYKRIAQQRCCEFNAFITTNSKEFENAVKEILETREIKQNCPFIRNGEKVFLIENTKRITVTPLNNSRVQTMLGTQYWKLNQKLTKQNPVYEYSFESYSIYYKLPDTTRNYILKIES